MNKKSKISAQELLTQFNSEITNGICNLRSYDDVAERLDVFIDSFPNEKSMSMIYELFGRDNEHLEHWVNSKFDRMKELPVDQRGIIIDLYEQFFSKRILNSLSYLHISKSSLPKLLMQMELFPLIEMWFNTNLPKAHIDADELVTNMCDFVNDVYELDKSDFEKIYSNYAEDNLAA